MAVTAFSVVYFGSTLFRASQKPFWFDELFTVYLSRLQSTAALWNALKHGADLNPPVLYLLTRISESFFGEGPIATRLPEILGFWIFSLCVFRFVSRRASLQASTFAMLFPMTTSAYFYAYDARAHGIVLGLGGLAMVCWQSALTGKRRQWWTAGLAVSLFCAVLTHTYALLWIVPFAVAESFRFACERRVQWGIWLAIVLPLSGVVSSLPLFQISKSTIPGVFPATLFNMSGFYISALEPAFNLLILVFVVCLAARPTDETASTSPAPAGFFPAEKILLLCLVGMPVFEYFLALVTGAPLVNRYSIALVTGFACLIGLCVARRSRAGNWALVITFGQIAITLLRFVVSGELIEPTTNLVLPNVGQMEKTYTALRTVPEPQARLVVLDGLEFLPVFFYAPADLSSRLTYTALPDDVNGRGYARLQECCQGPQPRFEVLDDLISRQENFVALSTPRTFDKLEYLRHAGAKITILSADPGRFLVSVTFGRQRAAAR
jgi:hypothetical protein